MTRFRSFLILLIATALLAETASAIDSRQAELLQEEAGAQFFQSGAFIVPNESHYELFEPGNRDQTGAFIGVGTFRVLAGASYGNFDTVVFADLDQRVVDFNVRQIAILKESPTIEDFLANLLAKPELKSDLREFLRNPARGYSQGVAKALAPNEVPSYAQDRFGNSPPVYDPAPSYVQTLLRYAAVDDGRSFLRNAEVFERLRHIALADRMISIPASLTGATTYEALARMMNEEGIKVGVLDVSNAPDYFAGDKEAWRRFVRNLDMLPFAETAHVNFTSDHVPQSHRDFTSWNYTSVPATAYLRASHVADPDQSSTFVELLVRMRTLHVSDPRNSTCSTIFMRK